MNLEQPEKIVNPRGLNDLEKNIINFQKLVPFGMKFKKLSQLSSSLFLQIGYKGKSFDSPPIPESAFKRIVERGLKFYQNFGWNKEKVITRSKIIATCESLVGEYLKKNFKNGVMIYTPTMLERAQVYSGMSYEVDPLPMIFPKKGL